MYEAMYLAIHGFPPYSTKDILELMYPKAAPADSAGDDASDQTELELTHESAR